MDPFRTAGNGLGPASFYRRLAGSDEVTLTLLDGAKQAKAVLHFDAGSAIADARKALKAADWSCAGAAPAPPLASHWEKAH